MPGPTSTTASQHRSAVPSEPMPDRPPPMMATGVTKMADHSMTPAM